MTMKVFRSLKGDLNTFISFQGCTLFPSFPGNVWHKKMTIYTVEECVQTHKGKLV